MNWKVKIVAEVRNALFLYPKVDTLKASDQRSVFSLISDLKIIANISNQEIEKILRDNSFAYIRCLPSINVEELHSASCINDEDAERVRICVIGYDDTSYEKAYSSICKNYNNNKLKISHLVGLKISSKSTCVKFYKPENSMFDVVVETGLVDLQTILVSIMLDISIYHYFSLSSDLQYRKTFSQLKIDYIRNSENKTKYGEKVDFDIIKYLPFSYPYVSEMNRSYEKGSEILTSLLRDYFDFITKCVCEEILYSSLKELEDPYAAKVPPSHLTYISKTISCDSFCVGTNYYVAINKKMEETIDGNQVHIIHADKDAMSAWLSKFSVSLTEYSLYFVKIGA